MGWAGLDWPEGILERLLDKSLREGYGTRSRRGGGRRRRRRKVAGENDEVKLPETGAESETRKSLFGGVSDAAK